MFPVPDPNFKSIPDLVPDSGQRLTFHGRICFCINHFKVNIKTAVRTCTVLVFTNFSLLIEFLLTLAIYTIFSTSYLCLKVKLSFLALNSIPDTTLWFDEIFHKLNQNPLFGYFGYWSLNKRMVTDSDWQHWSQRYPSDRMKIIP